MHSRSCLQWYQRILWGAFTGVLATLPMTLFMLIMQSLLPRPQRYALPPEQITASVAQETGVRQHLNKPQLQLTSLLAHFGFGGAAGAVYASFFHKLPLPAFLKGILFGLLVWLGAYLGWFPARDMSVAATREPAQRNLLMILAHIIWGGCMGVFFLLSEKSRSA